MPNLFMLLNDCPDMWEPRQGKNPAVEAGGFWVQACFSTGMLLKYSGKFYLATGSTPAVLNASGIDCEPAHLLHSSNMCDMSNPRLFA